MSEKYLGEYIDDMFDLIEPLSEANKHATAMGFMNLMVKRYPKSFLMWTKPMVNHLPHVKQHPHYDVIRELRKEAHGLILKQVCDEKPTSRM